MILQQVVQADSNLEQFIEQYRTGNHEDPNDISYWTYDRLAETMLKADFALSADPRKWQRTLDGISCKSLDADDINDFVFAYKRALVKNETHQCSRNALSASDGAQE
jgi:hypothetical protein